MHSLRRLAVMLLAIVALVAPAAPAGADVSADTVRGPDPTDSYIEQSRGAYAVGEESISRLGSDGFRRGTIY